tara:strand:+ start:149 stop:616 length:468 start_codon:yes stop_codon:yes gene_type:complete
MKAFLYTISIILSAFINPFFSQQISTLDGRFLSQSGELLEGDFETFYATGELRESFQLINGIQQGDFISYYTNQMKQEEGSYHYGLKIGKWNRWSESGVLISQTYYSTDGKKHGNWKIWDNEGNLKALMIYENGKRVGSWKIWDENGQLAQIISY